MVRNARKWLSAVLAVMMLVSMVSTVAFAAEPVDPDALYAFTVNEKDPNASDLYFYGVEMSETAFALQIEKSPYNYVKVYKEVNGEKGAEQSCAAPLGGTKGSATLQLDGYVNQYIVTLFSQNGQKYKDYSLTVEKNQVLITTPTAYTVVEEADGSVTYQIPYESSTAKFKLNFTDVNIVVAENGTPLTAVNGEYTVNFVQPGKKTFSITYGEIAEGVEQSVYTFSIEWMKNDKAKIEILEAETAGCVLNEYKVTVPKGVTEVALRMKFSSGATAEVINDYTGEAAAVNGNLYTLDYTGNRDLGYTVTVTAQDGTKAAYTITLVRLKSEACELLSIEGALLKDGEYVADIKDNTFYVGATVSSYASYALYSDAACTKAVNGTALQLQAAKTEVWIVVTAEDGVTKSAPVKLTVNTTATNFETSEEKPLYQSMVNLGKVAVTGGEELNNPAPSPYNNRGYIRVTGSALGEEMFFKIQALGEYEERGVLLYADVNKTILLENELYITPDSQGTALYAVIESNGVKEEYIVQIVTEASYTFTDKLTPWAEKYVKAVGEAGLMKGKDGGVFDGTAALTRNEMATLLVRLTGANKDLYANLEYKFLDAVPDWVKNYVKAATRIGLVDGEPVTDKDGNVTGYNFVGERNATRGEFIKVFANAIFIHEDMDVEEYYNKNKVEVDRIVTDYKFKDIESVADWAKPYMYTAVALGLVEGSSEPDGVYLHTENQISRDEVAAIIARSLPGEE
ncbi:MAG: S-layer homology domain-containing protein [Clostridia bacterium]|nr:S-layer homology domain-containing protein [Clostridia bacterium]